MTIERFSIGGSYVWASFIDTQVIDYYDQRLENFKAKAASSKPEGVRFEYESHVFTWDQIRVVCVPAPEGGSEYDDSIQILSRNGSVLLRNAQYTGPGWGMKFAYGNNSEPRIIGHQQINYSLPKSYVIEMTLTYEETWGPLAAFFAKVYQIIIIGQNLKPLLLCVDSLGLIS